MLEREKVKWLSEEAKRIKALLPEATGSVTFHLSKRPDEPQVELRLCDVTGRKRP